MRVDPDHAGHVKQDAAQGQPPPVKPSDRYRILYPVPAATADGVYGAGASVTLGEDIGGVMFVTGIGGFRPDHEVPLP